MGNRVANIIGALGDIYQAPARVTGGLLQVPAAIEYGLRKDINPVFGGLAVGGSVLASPLVAVPVSTGTGVVANNLIGNPLGGAIDAVTFGATDLKPNEVAIGEVKPEDPEMKTVNENFQARYGRPMTSEEYYRIQNELQKRRNTAMQRARMIEYQQEAMENYR